MTSMRRKTLSYLYRRTPIIFKTAYSIYYNFFKALQFAYWHFLVRNHTHASIPDLLFLQMFVRKLNDEQITGTIVECGSWKGGSAALIQKCANKLGWKNEIYVFDSFEGFPIPDRPDVDGLKAQGIKEGKYDWIKANENDVVSAFNRLGIYGENVKIVKGWFNVTTPNSPAQNIVLLHCDGDLYESTHSTLKSFYHKVVSGGYIVSNDYGDIWIGAKKAFDEWIALHCPEVKIERVPGGGAFFRKP